MEDKNLNDIFALVDSINESLSEAIITNKMVDDNPYIEDSLLNKSQQRRKYKLQKKMADERLRAVRESAEPEEVPEEELEQQEQPAPEEGAPVEASTNIVVTPDGGVQASTAAGTSVAVDNTKTVQIQVMEAEQPAPEEVPAEEQQPVEQAPTDEAMPRVQISMPVDGSMTIDNQGKQIQADAEGNLSVALAEAKSDSEVLKLLDDKEPEKPVDKVEEPSNIEGNDIDFDKLSDNEKYNLLSDNGYEPTLKNLENIKSLGIKVKKAEEPKEEKEDNKKPEEKLQPKVIIKSPAVKLQEKKIFKSHTNFFLESYLPSELEFSKNEVAVLTESDKNEVMRALAHEIIEAIYSKLSSVDTSSADRSRGDIKSLKELPELQNAITQLEAVLERSSGFEPTAKQYLGTIVKAILHLNQYSQVFRDGYRTKKTLLILRYESLILSIISSVSYLISALLDTSDNNITLKKAVSLEYIAPLKTLDEFNKSVESGEFKIITSDVNILREYYNENSLENMSKLFEAPDVISLVSAGIKTLYNDTENSPKLISMLYKATGIVVLLLSIRDAFYTLSRMKLKMSDAIDIITKFANINNGGNLKDLSVDLSKYKTDAESSTDMTKNEISSENKKLARDIRAAQAAPVLEKPAEKKIIPPAEDIFSIDF